MGTRTQLRKAEGMYPCLRTTVKKVSQREQPEQRQQQRSDWKTAQYHPTYPAPNFNSPSTIT